MEKLFYCVALCFGMLFNQHNYEENEVLEIILGKIYLPKSIKKIYVVPIDGCGGCIQKMRQLIIKNQRLSDEIFIITSPNKKKIHIYAANIPKKNVVLDIKSLALKENLVSIYPIVFYLSNSKILKSEIIDANNIDSF